MSWTRLLEVQLFEIWRFGDLGLGVLDMEFYWALFSFYLRGGIYANPALVSAKVGNLFMTGYCNSAFFFATTLIEP